MATQLKAKTIEAINSDPNFFAHVAIALKVKPTSLANILRRNGRRLTEHDILKSIADYMGKEPNEIIDEIAGVTA